MASDPARLRRMSLVGLLSGLTYLLYILRFPGFVFFPNFLEINLSEVSLFILGLVYGPFAAIFGLVFRFVVAIPFSSTSLIGEIADVFYSGALVLPIAFLYPHWRTKQGALVGLLIGFFAQLIVTSLLNVYWITDAYLELFFGSASNFVAFIQQTNPLVTDPYWSLVLFVYLPFNVIKNSIILTITVLSYKRIYVMLKRFR
jgi:riboflavin transporter